MVGIVKLKKECWPLNRAPEKRRKGGKKKKKVVRDETVP